MNPDDTDIYVAKHSASGQLLWDEHFAGAANRHDFGLAVTLDANDNIIVAGSVTLADQTTDIAVLK